jgi:HSP20 family molecular chaperone IbpA
MEVNSGPFERAIPLPARVEPEGTTATIREGMLEITLPKVQQQRITINVVVADGGR